MSTRFAKLTPYLRWAVSGLLLLVLFRLIDFSALMPALVRIQPAPLLIAFALLVIDRFFYGVRWQMILQPYGGKVRTWSLIRITFVSTFLANFLPSALSADVVRGYFLRKEEAEMATVISSVFLDRMIGFGALLILSVVAGVTGYVQGIFPLDWMIFVLTLLGISVVAIAICLSPWFRTIITTLQQSRFRLLQRIGKVVAVIRCYPWTLTRFLRIMGFSCFVYFLSTIASYLIFRSTNVNLPIGYFFLFVLLVQIAIAVPISVGGLGVHEGAWVLVLGSAGVAPEEALLFSLLLRTSGLLVSLPGGVLMALYRPHMSHKKLAATNDDPTISLDQTGILKGDQRRSFL